MHTPSLSVCVRKQHTDKAIMCLSAPGCVQRVQHHVSQHHRESCIKPQACVQGQATGCPGTSSQPQACVQAHQHSHRHVTRPTSMVQTVHNWCLRVPNRPGACGCLAWWVPAGAHRFLIGACGCPTCQVPVGAWHGGCLRVPTIRFLNGACGCPTCPVPVGACGCPPEG